MKEKALFVDMLDNAAASGVKFGTVNGKCTLIFLTTIVPIVT
jgi:hypothetical protein